MINLLIEFGILSHMSFHRFRLVRKGNLAQRAIVMLFYLVLMIGEECHNFNEFLSLLPWDKVVF